MDTGKDKIIKILKEVKRIFDKWRRGISNLYDDIKIPILVDFCWTQHC